MEELVIDCFDCGESASSVFDHRDGCPFALGVAENEIESIEDILGTTYETDRTQDRLDKLRTFVEEQQSMESIELLSGVDSDDEDESEVSA